jgi:hypothetical protein
MKTQAQAIGIAVLLMVFGIPLAILLTAQAQKTNNPAQQNPAPANDAYKLSGPYTHDNLTIFLVHGKDTITNRNILTLQEALEQKKVIVHETQDVNELAIENVSRDADVFVQSGDIVKGGQQDRMLAVDLIVPPRSGRIKIAAFCVESGRWSKRGNEESTKFTASSDRVATKDLKVAANRTNAQQSEVWDKVGEAQVKLSNNVGGSVNSVRSKSSLQLSLEDKKVKQTTDAYLKALSQVIAEKKDVIGYAFAINGQINSADVYASSTLFKKLWPKLLKASAVEAVAEKQQDKKFEQAKEADVHTFFAAAQSGKASENNVNARTKMVTRETAENMLLESRDMKQKEAWVHRSYIKLK